LGVYPSCVFGAMVRALSERQTRELEFYEEFSKRNEPPGISFDSISGQDAKPWNSYRRLIDIVRQHFSSEHQRLLDFGCGKGEFSLLLSKIGYEVFGFDISPNNIAIAKRLAGKYEMSERTHFQVGVAEKLDYPADYFDVVIGTDILHHVEISQALAECSRVLKKGGIAIFHEPVRVPVFDTLRETRFGKWLVPKEVSLEHHVTQDERKLSADDLELIRSFGVNASIQQFLFLSRLERFFRSSKVSSFFEKVDFYLFRVVPPLKRFGGVAIIVLGK
jgi:ubiquinone/menaquinone biosynthesis C-methylase UbiE